MNKKEIKLFLLILSFNIKLCAFSQDQQQTGNSFIYPLYSTVPSSLSNDLLWLKKEITGKKIIALGETTHGTHEVFQLKHKIIKYLVEEENIRLFAIEASMEDAYVIDQYINTGTGDVKKLLGKLGYWTWMTDEMLELIEWMKNYNSKLKSDGKIKFYGFDLPTTPDVVHEMLIKLQGRSIFMDSLIVTHSRIMIAASDYYKRGIFQLPQSFFDSSYSCCKNICNYMDSASARIFFKDADFERKNKIGDLICQYVRFNSVLKPHDGFRDSCMAANIKWILENNYEKEKIIVWAHNGHIKRTSGTTGYYLSSYYHTDLLVIGFSLWEGYYTAINRQTSQMDTTNILSKPDSTCYEYYFNMVGIKNFVMNIQQAKSNMVWQENFRKASKFREIGSMSRESQFFDSNVEDEYNMIIHHTLTGPSRIFSYFFD